MARVAGALLVVALALVPAAAQPPASRTVILSTTTSTQDSGLLDVLVPMFEQQTGFTLKTVPVGTGQALALAARGEADVVLVHAPSLEKKYVEEGTLSNRRLVMVNDFVVVGPTRDPGGVRGETRAVAALAKIAASGSRFVSRGDRSGTHVLEQSLWKQAGVRPAAPWYIESGQGMGATLALADDRQAYTLSDRGTYLAFGRRVALSILVEGDRALLNVYAVLEVNPANGPRVNTAGGRAFADFMLAPGTQAVIKTFGVASLGQPLFVPIAGRTDSDL